MKIVINTNTSYRKPLTVLIDSILNSGFSNFKDIIVVFAESESDQSPKLELLSNIVDTDSLESVVVINSIRRNYDYCGFNALNIYKTHPLVESDSYFYLLDTTRVTIGFWDKIQSFKPTKNQIITAPTPSANIFIFDAGFIDYYGDSFDTDLTKQQAISLECSNNILVNGKLVKSLTRYGNTLPVYVKRRLKVDEIDIYETGHNRVVFYYVDFGVFKYVLWDRDGDIKNNIVWVNKYSKYKKESSKMP